MTHYSAFAKNPAKIAELRAVAAPMGFVYDDDKPDFMITIGGDGTFLLAERRFPGIPKLLIRDSFVCFKCHDEPVARMLEIIKSGTWRIEEIPKLKVSLDGTAPTATNDIVIRNADPRHALRFRLRVDDEPVDDVLIGDGVVVATPFGSTGYFHSVTGRTFATGIGIGFNNPTRPRAPLVLGEGARIELSVTRNEAHLTADNHPELHCLHPGDHAAITRAAELTRLVGHE